MRSVWLGLWLALVLAAGAATGAPLVYHSVPDNGVVNGPVVIPKTSSVTLNLWIDPGSQPISGTICNNATGDASCAYDLRVQSQGGSQLVSFLPTGGSLCTSVSTDVGCKLTASMLRVNRILISAPLVGKQRLGTLTVNTSSSQPNGFLEVTGVHSVGAARQLQNITPRTVAYVPEPGMLVLLFSGLAGLAALHRLRGSD
jgi:hypothetical protein